MRSVKQVARMLSRQPAPPVRLRQGVVTDINTGRTVDLTIGGVELTGVPCLTSAVPRVGSAVMVIVCGRDMFVLGSVADDTNLGYTPLVQHGEQTIELSAAVAANETVSFGWDFPSAPTVLVSCDRGSTSTLPYVGTATDVTATDFVGRVRSVNSTSNTDNVQLRWAALHLGE